MEKVDFKVINSKELLELFNSLTPKTQENIVKRGLINAGRIILNQAKSNFNSVKKNKSKTDYQKILAGFKISALKSDVGVRIGNSFYKSLWIEKGTEDRFYTKNGKKHATGRLVRTDFFDNAVNSKKDEAQSKVSEAIIAQLDKVVKKYNLK